MAVPDVRLNTLPVRSDANGVNVVSYDSTGKAYGLPPAALYPTATQLGAATTDALNAGLVTKQDVAGRGVANGYAPLDGSGKVPAINLPAVSGGTPLTLTDNSPPALGPTALAGTATQAARADHIHILPTAAQVGAAPLVHTHSIAAVNGLQAALDARESLANKGVPGGYVALDTSGKVPAANLPPGVSANDLALKADITYVDAGLATKSTVTAFNSLAAVVAGKADNNDTRIVNAVQPGYLTPRKTITASYVALQADHNTFVRVTATSDITVTLPALLASTTIRWLIKGTGKVTFTAGSGVTLASFGNFFSTAGINANVITTMDTATTWDVSGNLA